MGIKVLRSVTPGEEKLIGYSHHCPGCGYSHMFYTEVANEIGAKWTFVNKNMNAPTFRASMLVNKDGKHNFPRCHYYVTDGEIQYLDDCTHKLAGQTIEMEDIE